MLHTQTTPPPSEQCWEHQSTAARLCPSYCVKSLSVLSVEPPSPVILSCFLRMIHQMMTGTVCGSVPLGKALVTLLSNHSLASFLLHSLSNMHGTGQPCPPCFPPCRGPNLLSPQLSATLPPDQDFCFLLPLDCFGLCSPLGWPRRRHIGSSICHRMCWKGGD